MFKSNLIYAWAAALLVMEAGVSLQGKETFLRSEDGRSWKSDRYEIHNLGTGYGLRKNVGLWRCFMHGRTDFEARPVAFDDLVQFDSETNSWLKPETMRNPFKKSNMKVIHLAGYSRKILQKHVLGIEELSKFRGKRVRFYVWMKGVNCGVKTDLLTGAPKVNFLIKDGLGNLIRTVGGKFKTRGTFPWFCYNVEVEIPAVMDFTVKKEVVENSTVDTLDMFLDSALGDSGTLDNGDVPPGSGLFISFENPSDGEVFFSTLSWELVTSRNTVSLADCTDPRTGSKAPNPDYDELPMHVIYSMGGFNKLDFLKGNHVTPNLLTVDGLNEYFQKARNDSFHMLHGIPYLNYFAQTGEILKLIPALPSDWKDVLLFHLEELQNKKTGLWSNDILVTHAIVKNNFTPTGIQRHSSPLRKTSWLAVAGAGVPHAKELLNTVVKARGRNKNGKTGWNLFSFMPKELQKMVDMNDVHLSVTSAAVELLGLLKTQIREPELKKLADDEIYDVYCYVLKNFFTREHLWKQSLKSTEITSGAFMYNLLNATSMLDPEVLKKEYKYDLAPIFNADGGVSLSWKVHAPDFVALRIYAAPKKVKIENLKEENIVGIIEKSSRHLWTMDPYHVMLLMKNAAVRQWGITLASEGALLLEEKMKNSYPNIVFGEDIQEITIPLPVFKTKKNSKKVDTTGMSAEEIEKMKAQAVVDGLNKELSEEEIEANKMVYYSQMVNARGQVTPMKKIVSTEIGQTQEDPFGGK